MNNKFKMFNKQNKLTIFKINKNNIQNMIRNITTIIIMIKIKIKITKSRMIINSLIKLKILIIKKIQKMQILMINLITN